MSDRARCDTRTARPLARAGARTAGTRSGAPASTCHLRGHFSIARLPARVGTRRPPRAAAPAPPTLAFAPKHFSYGLEREMSTFSAARAPAAAGAGGTAATGPPTPRFVRTFLGPGLYSLLLVPMTHRVGMGFQGCLTMGSVAWERVLLGRQGDQSANMGLGFV